MQAFFEASIGCGTHKAEGIDPLVILHRSTQLSDLQSSARTNEAVSLQVSHAWCFHGHLGVHIPAFLAHPFLELNYNRWIITSQASRYPFSRPHWLSHQKLQGSCMDQTSMNQTEWTQRTGFVCSKGLHKYNLAITSQGSKMLSSKIRTCLEDTA